MWERYEVEDVVAVPVTRDPRLLEGLFDWRMRKFITRKVTAALYTIVFWLVVASTPVVAYAAYRTLRGPCDPDGVCAGVAPGYAALAIPGVLVVAFLTLLSLRLAMETSSALVAIAQNTEPKPHSSDPFGYSPMRPIIAIVVVLVIGAVLAYFAIPTDYLTL